MVSEVACLGFGIDEEKNKMDIEDVVQEVGARGSCKTLVCLTDEQFEMARGCAEDEELFS